MRRLTFLIIVVVIAYGAYWLIASSILVRNLDEFAAQPQPGPVFFTYEARDVTGFPSRFDVSLHEPRVRWAPFAATTELLQIFALSYRPNHVIGFIPHPIKFSTPYGELQVSNDDLRASLVVSATPAANLRELLISATGVSVPTLAAVPSAQLAMRQTEGSEYEIYAEAGEISLRPDFQSEDLPDTIERIKIRAIAAFDTELGRESRGAQLERLEILEADAVWGPARLEIGGQLHLNLAGRFDGEITVRAANLSPVLGAAAKLFPVGPGVIARGIEAAEDTQGNVVLPLKVRDSTAYFGPVPIFRLPALIYRQ